MLNAQPELIFYPAATQRNHPHRHGSSVMAHFLPKSAGISPQTGVSHVSIGLVTLLL